jgi:thiamine biosynthesis lipoprotein
MTAPPVHRFSHECLGSFAEVLIAAREAAYAGRAATAVFDEIDRLEGLLSRFAAESDVSRINAAARGRAVAVSIETFACLRIARRVCEETAGAFDVTVGALTARGEFGPPGGPTPPIHEPPANIGMHLLEMNEEDFTVTPQADGVRIDLGGVGKGYVLDTAAALLREWDLAAALLHAGRSSALALDAPPGEGGWPVAICDPARRGRPFGTLWLTNAGFAVSGVHAKGRHIVDPRTALPAERRPCAWAVAASAAEADALATAFMAMDREEIETCCRRRPGICAAVLEEGAIATIGGFPLAPARPETRDAAPG